MAHTIAESTLAHIFSFEKATATRAVSKLFKTKLDDGQTLDGLYGLVHVDKKSICYFNSQKKKELSGDEREKKCFDILMNQYRRTPIKAVKQQCFAKTKKGTRCKFSANGTDCGLFCSRHKNEATLYWMN